MLYRVGKTPPGQSRLGVAYTFAPSRPHHHLHHHQLKPLLHPTVLSSVGILLRGIVVTIAVGRGMLPGGAPLHIGSSDVGIWRIDVGIVLIKEFTNLAFEGAQLILDERSLLLGSVAATLQHRQPTEITYEFHLLFILRAKVRSNELNLHGDVKIGLGTRRSGVSVWVDPLESGMFRSLARAFSSPGVGGRELNTPSPRLHHYHLRSARA